MRKFLNIGCGEDIKRSKDVEWTNVDIRNVKGVDKVCPADKLPFGNNTFDRVYACHLLEHFAMSDTARVLEEWVRVAKKGGEVWIAVPDILKVAKGFVNSDIGRGVVMKYLYGGQGHEWNFHKAGFCCTHLEIAMRGVGLGSIRRFPKNEKDASNSEYSLNLKGIK